MQKAPIHQSHIYGQIKILRTKGSPKEHSCEIISKSDLQFWRKEFFLEFLHVHVVQKAPIHKSYIYRQIKILRTISEKGHPRNIPVKLFQNLTSSFGEIDFLRISSCPYSARSPNHQSLVYGWIKISRTIFENGHPRNIPVKLFQNLNSSFREKDFLRISSCPYSARSPDSPEPCLWTYQNFANSF